MAQDTRRLGMIGIGNMGMPIARSVARSGIELYVHDRREAALEEAKGFGASAVGSATELAGLCNVISLVVVGDEDVREVLTGEGGLLAALGPGAIVMIQSTVLPQTVRDLAAAAGERGIRVLDAPVSGGPERAAQGELTLICGGDTTVVEECRSLLESMGHVRHVGPVGAGQAMKLVNNMIVSAERAVIFEAMQLGVAYGISNEIAREVALESTAESWVMRNLPMLDDFYWHHPLAGDTEALLSLMTKDIWYAVLAARAAGVHLPITAMIASSVRAIHLARRAQLTPTDLPRWARED
jgi:3-hydroxyisobutyrate dehydrogenase-like beta-hydroxyacid dehydrogenase